MEGMEGEQEAAEKGVGGGSQDQSWVTTSVTTFEADQNDVGGLSVIIVPELSCISHDQSGRSLTLEEVTGSNSIIQTQGPALHSHMKPSDSLAALAAAAEMNQVSHIINESKYASLAPHQADTHVGHLDIMTDNPNATLPMIEEKLQCLHSLPMPPFLNPNDPDAVFYNEVYHYLQSGTFPGDFTEAQKKIVKKRATNYLINDKGTLSYGKRNPRLVVTDPNFQQEIISESHIDPYNDIGNYVRNCGKCNEISAFKGDGRDLCCDKDMRPGKAANLPADRVLRVWKTVHVKIYGPYSKTIFGNEVLITIYDPFSRWIVAEPAPPHSLDIQCANFIFDTFCRFGFAKCQVIGMECVLFEQMRARYNEKFEGFHGILKNLISSETEDANCFSFTYQDDLNECAWAGELIDSFCTSNPTTWDEDMNQWLFQHCTSLCQDGSCSPFALMFGRSPTGLINEEDKENLDILEEEKALEVFAKRRKLRSSTLQCRHCYETFTSKISFRIHQRKHTEEARKQGMLKGEKLLKPRVEGKTSNSVKKSAFLHRKRKPFGRGNVRFLTLVSSDWTDQEIALVPHDETRQQLTLNTVAAVKGLLSATKEERSKRGRYFKYDVELKEEIAKYALQHSIPDAVQYWSEKLGSPLSESTVRNFIKVYKVFTPDIKEEIGKYALMYGVDKATEHFSKKLKQDIRKGLIRRFKLYYLQHFPELCQGLSENSHLGDKKKFSLSTKAKQKRMFSPQVKMEIGRYSCQYGLAAAIQHFSGKLQFPVKESTVRKFKRQYLEHEDEIINVGSTNDTTQSAVVVTEHAPPQTVDVLQPSLSALNSSAISCSAVSAPSNFVYQHSYPLNMTHIPQNNQTSIIPMNNSLAFQGGVINQGVTSLPYQQSGNALSSVIMNQNFSQQAPAHFQQGYGGFTTTGVASHIGQMAPLAMTHTSGTIANMSHSTSPISLSMNNQSAHLSPISSALGIAQNQLPHSGTIISQPISSVHNSTPQQVIASYHQPIVGNTLTFEQGGSHVIQNNATVSISNEPLNLLKEEHPHQNMPNINQETVNSQILQARQISVSSGISFPVSVVALPQINMQQTEAVTSNEAQSSSDQGNLSVSLESEEEYSDPPTPPKKKSSRCRLRGRYRNLSKRGNYVSYSPELRARIGKYAAEHGNLAAVKYFKSALNFEIPESTVRGLKDKYLIKKVRGEKEVETLGFAPRGRPMRLGKYDEIVQECIKELVKEGEKVTSFLVIATAKQVLMQYEPSLLEENGGPIKLNPTWAKSFVKRIGIHQLA